DFWTYTCINCLRTLPHLEAWDAAYREKGLVIVGVHTPEFAFEHSASNVEAAIRRLGVHYPVPLDNEYATWDAYSNQYWPAEYLVDRSGHVRHVHFGEGEYDQTEALIRRLLAAHGRGARLVADTTPREATTPESYLGFRRLVRYDGSRIVQEHFAAYMFPKSLPQDGFAYAGKWEVRVESILAGRALVLIAQEPRQLGGDRVARGQVRLGLERVDLLLERLDIRLRVRVRGDRLGHLLDVFPACVRELGEVDLGPEQLREPRA